MIEGDTRNFSWAWVTFEVLGLLVAWVATWLHWMPRLGLGVVGVAVLFALLVEVSRFYRAREMSS